MQWKWGADLLNGIHFEQFTQQLWHLLPRLLGALVIVLLFRLTGRLLARLMRGFAEHHGDNDRRDILTLLAQILSGTLLVIGLVTALGVVGVDVSALVAGLGLTGFALGFALRDALSNVLAGGLVLFYRPFRRGDFISVDGKEGTVTQIDLRYTTLQGDGRRILIPNSNLFTTAIQVIEHPAPPPAPPASQG